MFLAHMRKAAIPFIILILCFVPGVALSQNVEHPKLQVTLFSDKSEYAAGEPVTLWYEVLWLGTDDAEIYFNALSFPEIEVLYKNRKPLSLNRVSSFNVRSKPGRHEIRTFAPTMKGTSEKFVVNASSNPVRFLNGAEGYYVFEKPGAYTIRAKFPLSSVWKLSDKQDSDIISKAIVIKIK